LIDYNQSDLLKGIRSNTDTPIFAVNSVFDTIQGEGFLVGTNATFVRFNICHVGCTFCDTAYTWRRINKNEFMTAEDIMVDVRRFNNLLVVLTGGEPLEQPHLSLLVGTLLDQNYQVQIETSGIVSIQSLDKYKYDDRFYLTVSPKGEAHKSFKDMVISDLKLLVDVKTEYEDIMSRISDYCPLNAPKTISLQPIEEFSSDLTKRNTARAIKLVKLFGKSNYRNIIKLSIQIHKIIGIE